MEDGGGFLEIGNRKMSLNFRQVMGHHWLVVMALTVGASKAFRESQTFCLEYGKRRIGFGPVPEWKCPTQPVLSR